MPWYGWLSRFLDQYDCVSNNDDVDQTVSTCGDNVSVIVQEEGSVICYSNQNGGNTITITNEFVPEI